MGTIWKVAGELSVGGEETLLEATWRGEYDPIIAYLLHDTVSYLGSSYICIFPCTGIVPTDITHWELVVEKGDEGDPGAASTVPGPQGPRGIQGTAGTDGTDGASGSQGIQGVAGQGGATGSQGIQGIQGVQGTAGSNGTNGTDGTDGAAGTTDYTELSNKPDIAGIEAKIDFVRPFPAPVVTGTYVVPLTIEHTGATDVHTALTDFIATVPDGSIIDFPAGATYLLDDGGILVIDKNNLIFNGNGATLVVGSNTAGDNYFGTPLIIGASLGDPAVVHPCTDIVVHDFVIVGNSPTPGVYIDGQEYEANLVVNFSDRVEVYDVTGSAAYGDCVYIKAANGVWVHDCHAPTCGRNGVSIISGSDILIERNAFDVSGWSTLDFEPNVITETISDVIARNNIAGTHGYALLALGSDSGGPIDGVVVDSNTVTGGSITSYIGNATPTDRMTRVVFTNNKGEMADGPVLFLHHVDGLTVLGNFQPLSSDILTNMSDCTGVTVQSAIIPASASAFSFVKEFAVSFPTGTANQKFDIFWTGSQTFDGLISVEVTDEYADANASGYLRKIFGIYTEDATIYTNVSKVTDVLGPIAAQDAISEFSWDATNSRYKIMVVHRTTSANLPTVRVSFFAQNATILSAVSTVDVTDVYTTDATVYGALVESAMPSAAGTVTLAQMANMATASLIYRKTASAGAPEVNTLATLKTDLGLTGTNGGDQTLSSLGIPNVDNTSDATKNAAAATLTNKRVTRRVDTQTTTDTITPEISTYDIFIRTAQAHALVINNHSSSTPVDGDMILFEILGDATPRAITYGNTYVAKAGVALPAATVASKNLTLLFIWRVDLTQWVLLSTGQEA